MGTPGEIAKRIVDGLIRPGHVLRGERFGWDIETWKYRKPDGTISVEAREWTPTEARDRILALAAEPDGIPTADQFVYLRADQLASADWSIVAELDVLLWIAAWDAGPTLARHWEADRIWLRQYTSRNNASLREVYDANLDLNRAPFDVWTTRELQLALNAAMPDFTPLVVDNDYGPATTSRVGAWQTRAKLYVDGDAGAKTLGTLTKPA